MAGDRLRVSQTTMVALTQDGGGAGAGLAGARTVWITKALEMNMYGSSGGDFIQT